MKRVLFKLTPAKRQAILAFYKGKARDDVERVVLPWIEEAGRNGWWPTGAKRSAVPKLHKLAGPIAKTVRDFDLSVSHWGNPIWKLRSELMYHPVQHADLLVDLAKAAKAFPMPLSDEEAGRDLIKIAEDLGAVFGKLAMAMRFWNLTPAFETPRIEGLSRTVRKTLLDANIDAEKVELVPTKWSLERHVTSTGESQTVWVGRIAWPKGTLHDSSRFSETLTFSKGAHDQCHACGHAIRNDLNWLPLVATGRDGQPHALWVGRDCGKKLFGVSISKDLVFEGKRGKAPGPQE